MFFIVLLKNPNLKVTDYINDIFNNILIIYIKFEYAFILSIIEAGFWEADE